MSCTFRCLPFIGLLLLAADAPAWAQCKAGRVFVEHKCAWPSSCVVDFDCPGELICEAQRCVSPYRSDAAGTSAAGDAESTTRATEPGGQGKMSYGKARQIVIAGVPLSLDLEGDGTCDGCVKACKKAVQENKLCDKVEGGTKKLLGNTIVGSWTQKMAGAACEGALDTPCRNACCADEEPAADGDTFKAAGLEWQTRPAEHVLDLEGARKYCQSLELAGGGWRLPTQDELQSLYQAKGGLSRVPGMGAYAEGAGGGWYRSSTSAPEGGWCVNFETGASKGFVIGGRGSVRCVR